MEKTTVVGVDLAKTVFEIAVSDTPGQVSQKQRLPRSKFQSFFQELPPAEGQREIWNRDDGRHADSQRHDAHKGKRSSSCQRAGGMNQVIPDTAQHMCRPQ